MSQDDKQKQQLAPLTWKDALARFETHLRAARKSPLTLADYLEKVRALETHLATLREPPPLPEDVTVHDLREYVSGLLTGTTSRSGRPLKASSAATIVAEVASFFQFLHEDELISRDPTLRLERPRVPRAAPGETLTTRELERLLAACSRTSAQGLRDRALVELFYATGLRNDEALSLDLADLSHEEREVVVRKGKGEKGRVVPVTRSAWTEIVSYLERGRPALATRHEDSARALFLTRTGRRLETSGLRFVLQRLTARARVSKNVTPLVFRRTFAVSLLKNGVSVRHIQLLLGHEHLNTTATYLRLTTKDLRTELLLRHPRERIDA